MKHAFLALALTTVSCASPYAVRTIEPEKLEIKGKVGDQILALNEKDEAILQEEVKAQDELRIAEAVNYSFLEDARSLSAELYRCRKDMADPRLGGSGKLPDEIDVEDMATPVPVKERFGKDAENGDLKFVRQTYYQDRLKSAKSHRTSLERIIKLLKRQYEECEFKMTQARHKAGLPGQRYMAEGYFNEQGKWVETRKGEMHLDDGFDIQANFRK